MKSGLEKRCFHEACAKAVESKFGDNWSQPNQTDESWTANFQRYSEVCTCLLSLRLNKKSHVVEVQLGFERAQSASMPRTWWDDRTLHPNESGYRTVLWNGPMYGSERTIAVAKHAWDSEFSRTIAEQLAKLRSAAERWFAEVELYLNTNRC